MPRRMNFDRVAHEYEETRGLPPEVLRGLVSQLAAAFQEGTVLDAGVGTGRFAVPLSGEGLRVVGVDISPRMLARARAAAARDLALGDLAHLPFRDGSFDHAIAIHILHLLPDWMDAIREIARVTSTFVASTRETKTVSVHGRYDRILRELGHEAPDSRREAETYLASVPTALRFPTIGFVERRRGEDLVDLLAKKTFTRQWDVPDDLHQEAMRRIADEYRGRSFTSDHTWEVLVWRAEDLATG